MKLRDGIITAPASGICQIDIDKIIKCFGLSFISRWHDDYRLVNEHVGMKITISKDDAIEIIRRMEMQEVSNGIFNHGSTFHTKKRLDWEIRRRKRRAKTL